MGRESPKKHVPRWLEEKLDLLSPLKSGFEVRRTAAVAAAVKEATGERLSPACPRCS